MKIFRSILFWLHLAAGLVAGIAIGIMCFTGTVLAFEREIIAWAERDLRRITLPADGAARLPLSELVARVRAARPEARLASVVVSADPRDAVTFPLGREGALYADPHTGEVRAAATTRTRDFMRLMTDWHRYLARTGEQRPLGKAINGACNIAFCLLAITGLYLWLPRSWSWRGVKAVALFNWRLTGKARDFNWHNAIGLWSAPVLIVLTLTALPISYRWAGNLIYTLVGETPPAPAGPGAPATPAASGSKTSDRPAAEPSSPAGTPALDYDALLAAAQNLTPGWELLTLPLNNDPAGRSSRPAQITVKQPGSWPRTATTTLTLDPFSGAELKREGFGSLSTGRQIRTWTRFLHTGQALGWGGQFVAGLACLGGCFLVYTGFALAWRRFFGRMKNHSAIEPSALG
ncbi:MAG TPA: PepSY-associated TM helix domain-containing protein [Lacunisphaera sp.]